MLEFLLLQQLMVLMLNKEQKEFFLSYLTSHKNLRQTIPTLSLVEEQVLKNHTLQKHLIRLL